MGSLSYAKAKGREAESKVVEYLRERGFQAERRRLTGCEDCGDIAGIDNVVIEVKDEKRINLAGYMDEVAVEEANAMARFGSAQFGFAVLKRKGKPDAPHLWYAVLTLEDMVTLLKQAGWK